MAIGETWRRLRALVSSGRADRDLRREMALHMELLAADARDEGASGVEAMDEAHRRFGRELSWREATREAAGWASLDRLGQDVRFAARSLRRDRSLTAVAILVLALGLGGNVSGFSLFNATLLHPFPYRDPARLVEIEWRYETASGHVGWASTARIADFGYWRDRSTSFEAIAAYGSSRSNLIDQSAAGFEGPERVVVGRATEGFLRVLGVRPALGRFFTRDEDSPGGQPVVVLSHGAWKRRFGGRPGVLGQTMTLDGTVRTIVGVMPSGLVLPGSYTCEVWVPAAYDVAANMQPGNDTRWDGDNVVGRLRSNVSAEQAGQELVRMSRHLDELLHRRGVSALRAIRLGSNIFGYGSATMGFLLVVAGGLLLACVTLAGLLLARSTARAHEAAVRSSLGAGRLRLVRYALTEALLLAAIGGGAGLVLARWCNGLIGASAPAFLGLDSALRIDAPVVWFAVALSVLSGVTFGLVPAVRGSAVDVTTVLKGTSGGGRQYRRGRLLSALVLAEVTLALPLLICGGLTARSLMRLAQVDTGIRPAGVLTFRLGLTGDPYSADWRRLDLLSTLIGRLGRLPDVVSAAAVSPLPMSNEYSGNVFRIEGRPAPANPREMMAQFCQATPAYFRTMGVPVVLGREFDESDGPRNPAIVVNQTLARLFFPGENPLGHRLAVLGTTGAIVGVVGDIRHNGPAREPGPQLYYPSAASPARAVSVVVRTTGDVSKLGALVRTEVRAIDRSLPVEQLKAMSDVEGEALVNQRLTATLVGGFALYALALAGIGLYGVVAYSVSQRQHEIGVRMALGASPASVVGMMVRRGAVVAAAGLAIGVPIALGSVRLIASVLYGLSPYDGVVFTTVPLVLLAVALVASYLPARRAANLDPLAALRTE